MFTDPQSVTVDATPNTLPRVSVGDHSAVYANGDETLVLNLSHQSTKAGRTRRVVRINFSKFASDPFITGNQRLVSMSASLIIDEPSDNSFTNTEVLNNVKGLVGWASDANVTKVIAGES